MSDFTKSVDPAEVEESIEQLNTYVNDANIEPVLLALETLKNDPDNDSLVVKLAEALDSIGVMKGAILTYAPYIAVLMSKDLFDEDED